ncbi:MAG: HlyD family efflux transporter periplasmic adaptor subunit [Hornefia sp.]|nr:HlyD family efflux transporter periplasmic adaptor subunit [Hornefia sp.]
MEKFKKKPILVFAAVFLALYVIIYVIPGVTVALKFSYVAEYGNLEVSDEVASYFVRNERVYFSKVSGEENRYISEGVLVRRGTKVMEVSKGEDSSPERKFRDIRENIGNAGIFTDSFEADEEGIVTFFSDGREAEFTPEKIEKKSFNDLKRLDSDEPVELARKDVSSDDPVFKIVDRSAWYFVNYIPKNHKGRYKVGTKYSAVIDATHDIRATLTSMKEEGSKIKLVFKSDYFFKDLTTIRMAKIKIITAKANGLLIYNTSLATKDGKTGVYVKQNSGKYKFTPVQVIATDGEKSVIAKSFFYDEKGNICYTVKTYDDILKKG